MSNPSAKIDKIILVAWPAPKSVGNGASSQCINIDDTTKLSSRSNVDFRKGTISDKLTFTKHVNGLCTKACKKSNILTRTCKFLSHDSNKLVITSLISSNF